MTDLVVTMPQIRELIKSENLSPEDIFGRDYIEKWLEGREYAAKVVNLGEAALEDKNKAAEKKAEDYIDPAKNPFIKTGA